MGERYVTAEQIANLIGGFVSGDPDKKLYGISLPEDSNERMLTYIDKNVSEKKRNSIKCGAMIIQSKLMLPIDETFIVINSNIYSVLHLVVNFFIENKIYDKQYINPYKEMGNVNIGINTVIENESIIGKNTIIGNNVCIGKGVHIGDNCIIKSNVTILDNVYVGNNVIISSGSVIGSDSFEYGEDNIGYKKIPNIGGVIIEDNVEIGSNTTIDRGTIGSTIIGEGTKIDNLVQVAHEVKIGRNCKICSQCGLAGWSKVEENVVLYGKVGVNNNVTIGKNSIVLGASAVTKSINENEVVSGNPAIPNNEHLRQMAYLKKIFKERR